MATILVLNGPNPNLPGTREPGHYCNDTLDDTQRRLTQAVKASGDRLEFQHSSAGHQPMAAIHDAPGHGEDLIIFGPVAFTHTSVALREALQAALSRLRAL